ncbi:MAG: hypothetical protein PUA93_07045 [Eubacteriales bacterium]|nr:hypothetical protein [Eubacteriales bacterium]
MRTLHRIDAYDRELAWVDTDILEDIPFTNIWWPFLLLSDSRRLGTVYIVFVYLNSFQMMVTTWPFTIMFTGLFVSLYGLMFLGGAYGLFHKDAKYHFLKKKAAFFTILLLRLALFIGSLLLSSITTQYVETPLPNGGVSISVAYPHWPLILINLVVFFVIESIYHVHQVVPVEYHYFTARYKHEKFFKKEKKKEEIKVPPLV